MKLIILSIVLMCLASVGFGQTSNNYTLKVIFAPSFMYGCEFTVQSNGDNGFAILNNSNRYAPVIDTGKVATNYLKQINDIFKSPFSVDSTRRGFDGIDVGVSYQSNTTVKNFKFWSPTDGSKESKLSTLLINLMNDSFNKSATVVYIEQLEQYFPHKLGVKKISDRPLKYKLYGNITSSEASQLNDFFNSLPIKHDVFIDMSNFENMGTMFYDEFEALMHKNKKVYWVNPSYQALVQLFEAGVPNKNIISKKKVIKIEEKDRNRIITTKDY